jgi:hypothetical protein
VKFQTSDLITRIDNLLRDLEGKAITRAEERDEKLVGSQDAWLEDHSMAFRQFSTVIRKRLDAGQPVTSDDIPESIKGGYHQLKFYSAPSAGSPASENRQVDNLLKLKSALLASTEDTISPTAIKQLGFQEVTFLFTPEAAA